MLHQFLRGCLGAALLLSALQAAADTIKIAYIGPLSGPFALHGNSNTKHHQAIIDTINAQGGVLGGNKLELVALDGKGNPQDSIIALQQAIDQDIRFVSSYISSVDHAISEAVTKHNARNPERRVLFLDFGGFDPALTGEKCSFWHFHFDANSAMQMNVLTDYLAKQKSIRKVYLINQDYSYGQSVSRLGRELLAKKRPDIDIVGDDLHPFGKVKDFAPYAAKIKASGADTVITGNWSNDLALLLKASKDAGVTATYYTLLAFLGGTPATYGSAGEGVRTLIGWHPNLANNRLEKFTNEFKAKYKEDWIYIAINREFEMLAKAIDQAKSADPLKVALALEGMRYDSAAGEVWMRPDDHQLMVPLYIAAFTKAGPGGVKYDAEGTGFGWKSESQIDAKSTVVPNTCKFERPK
jgi:branched-chain amino acid transport system substrate-binding protein